jgi:hypothetical protein
VSVDLSGPAGAAYLREHYVERRESTYAIAAELGTYANLVRRALLEHGIELRTRGQAQAAALESGRAENPTDGRERTGAERQKIGEGRRRGKKKGGAGGEVGGDGGGTGGDPARVR